MTQTLPSDILRGLLKKFGSLGSETITIRSFSPTAGGCINEAGVLNTSLGEFFLKWNDRSRYPEMFEREASGLRLLRKATPLQVPEVIAVGETELHQYLVLEHIRSGSRNGSYWQDLGRGIALLHKASSSGFGLEHNNFIGSLPQSNIPSGSWVKFFIDQRLEKQLALMKQKGYADGPLETQLRALKKKLPDILPEEPPALLHGDLWSGNVLIDVNGGPCLIDPAVYYGNREVDLAMTQLFGGFPTEFYEAYQEVTPLEAGFEERYDVYNLYPLMVHVNLFGGSYLSQVRRVLDRFI